MFPANITLLNLIIPIIFGEGQVKKLKRKQCPLLVREPRALAAFSTISEVVKFSKIVETRARVWRFEFARFYTRVFTDILLKD
jgi:hypothetical protein